MVEEEQKRVRGPLDPVRPWFPPALRLRAGRPETESWSLPRTWVANEVGRSLVRAVEFATTSKTLLDRDRGRLLVTMDKAARRFSETDVVSAGVMIAYIVELGLGVRRSPSAEIDWHFDPLATLARLHTHFAQTKAGDPGHELLAVGTAAGVLKVAEAITAARARDQFERSGVTWNGDITADKGAVAALSNRTIAELRRTAAMSRFELFGGDRRRRAQLTQAVDLAKQSWFEPRDLPVILPTSDAVVRKLTDRLVEGTGLRESSRPSHLPCGRPGLVSVAGSDAT
jgi:hypothetical protein